MQHKIFSIPPAQNPKSKKECKRAFRDEFLKNPVLKNFKGTSYLHLAAKQKLYKEMARLIYYGADVRMTDVDGKTAFAYLNADENKRVTQLQTQLSKLIGSINENNVDIITRHIFNFNLESQRKPLFSFNFFHDQRHRALTFETLQRLNKDPLLQPLFDIVKLALLGLHDLSMRPKFRDTGYDSDDDINETTTFQTYLSFAFDSQSETVEQLIHAGVHGLEGEGSDGVYDDRNQICIGAKISLSRSLDKILTIFLHEITHFVCQEVFLNGCKPYHSSDTAQIQTFKQMVNNLKIRVNRGDVTIMVFKDIFKYYPEDKYASELIARITQLLFDDHCKQILKQQTPELLAFYENTFLPAVKTHVISLEERALSGWPKSCLKAKL